MTQPASTVAVPDSSAQQFYSENPQPGPHFQPSNEVPWSTGLCSIFVDFPNCWRTFCCPWVTFGQVSEIVDRGSSSCATNAAIYALINYFTGCGCIYPSIYRTKLRRQYRLTERPCGDCLVHFCCETCALSQEYRELKNRGFDMSIGVGWHGNVERENQAVEMAPVVEWGMKR